MRIAVVGRSRWAAQGVAAALSGDVDADGERWQADVHDVASLPPVDVCVALVDDGAALQSLLARLPRELPLAALSAAPQALWPLVERERRPLALLSSDTPDRRLHAAVAALAQGFSVHDGAPRPRAAAAAEAPIEPLTARELEVFELLARGLSNRDIAAALDISSHTAKFHVAQILDKTGAATRAEAVGVALRLGLIGV